MFMQVFIERAQRLPQTPYLVHLYVYGIVYLKFKYLDELMRLLQPLSRKSNCLRKKHTLVGSQLELFCRSLFVAVVEPRR